MTLPTSGMLDAAAIRTESKQSGLWDINNPLGRRIAKKPIDQSQIQFSDFYGKSNQRNSTFGGGAAVGVCAQPNILVGYISDYIPDYAAGETFRVVYGFYGSWANYGSEGYPCFQASFTVGSAASYQVVGNAGGGKSQYMTISYDGGNAFSLRSQYGGSSTSWSCNCTVYIFDFLYPDPEGIGAANTFIGNFNTYLNDHPATASFINHAPPPPAADTSTTDASTINSCFLIGSPVAMADGTFKPIEDVQVGEYLLGAHGAVNPVLALNRPLLGDRMMSNINGEHLTTLDHAHLRPDNTFGAVSLYEYVHGENNTVQVVITAEGDTEQWLLPGFAKADMDLITQIELGDYLVTVDGTRQVTSLEQVKLPADTQLYNFVMGGDHTYFVSDYCVTGFLNGIDFDYRNWKPVGQSWTRDQYRRG